MILKRINGSKEEVDIGLPCLGIVISNCGVESVVTGSFCLFKNARAYWYLAAPAVGYLPSYFQRVNADNFKESLKEGFGIDDVGNINKEACILNNSKTPFLFSIAPQAYKGLWETNKSYFHIPDDFKNNLKGICSHRRQFEVTDDLFKDGSNGIKYIVFGHYLAGSEKEQSIMVALRKVHVRYPKPSVMIKHLSELIAA